MDVAAGVMSFYTTQGDRFRESPWWPLATDAGAAAANLSYSVDDRVLAGSPWLPLTGTSPVLFPGRHVTKGGKT